ncbi:response regulator [Paenibacillus sp. sgz500958]|uniref:response regulator n=1 Tax=Paenibacillus sp. sgz500958 TaxID=3242475 RepID=UPI0036D38115
MKKVMLIDDEILIRESIRECIDWEKEGFLYCGDASDGELALPLIEQWVPDILITDIKMPFMDGLELSAIVRQQLPHTKIIILSGHDDFQYAQTALRLGVEDYCLKPVSSSDLIQLLHMASEKIDEEQRLKRKNTYTREQLVSDLCGGLISTGAAIEAAAQLGLQIMAPYYAVAIFGLPFSDSFPMERDTGVSLAAERWLAERLEGLPDSLLCKRSRTETILLLKGFDSAQLSETLEALSTSIHKELKAAFGIDLSISLGSPQERLQGVHASYLEAEEDKMWKKMSKQNRAALWEASYDPSSENILLDRNKLIHFLKVGTPKEAQDFIRDFAADLRSMNWGSMYAYYLINDITLEMVHTAKQSFHAGESPADLINELQHAIRQITGFQECLDYLNVLLERLWKWRYEGSDKYSGLIDQVKQHIRENYDNDQLSLYEISQQIGVSSSHLSKIFSQETGQTMTEFLTATRIGKAKELLKTTRYKTFEIAFRVGYNDQHYFSNLFKKVTGMTPMEYRRQDRPEEKAGVGRNGGIR